MSVDCVENPNICMNNKVQAFPMMRLFKGDTPLGSDYRGDRTLGALEDYITQQLALDSHVESLPEKEKQIHLDLVESQRADHPGCLLTGFLLVNRVPGNFHIEARSKHHNLNPVLSNLSHVVNHLSFGSVFSMKELMYVRAITARMLAWPGNSCWLGMTLTLACTDCLTFIALYYSRMDYVPEELFSYRATHPMDLNAYVNTNLHQAFHHHIKVVSTVINDRASADDSGAITAFQMVQASQVMVYAEEDIPEARFSFDIAPMAVRISRQPKPFYQFVTSMCAVLGGTFTVVGLVQGVLGVMFKPKKM